MGELVVFHPNNSKKPHISDSDDEADEDELSKLAMKVKIAECKMQTAKYNAEEAKYLASREMQFLEFVERKDINEKNFQNEERERQHKLEIHMQKQKETIELARLETSRFLKNPKEARKFEKERQKTQAKKGW
jgi:hypothetical protein